MRLQHRTNILLADDHLLLMDLWAKALSADTRFHICGKAHSASIAIDMAREVRPDIVLMDIHIGPIDGFEATRIIRNVSPRSKVIGLSGSALSSYAKKMKAVGALGYVTRCTSLEEMITAITTVLKGQFYFCSTIRKIMHNEERLHVHTDPATTLTKRELEIIDLVRRGLDGHQIAAQLNISRHTVYNHQNNIYKKLKVSNATAMIHAAHLKGI